jgi:hypothetical protein
VNLCFKVCICAWVGIKAVISHFTACLYKMPDGLFSLSWLVTLLKSAMIEKHVDCSVVGRICRVANVPQWLRYAHYLKCVFMPQSSVHSMWYFQKTGFVSSVTIYATILVVLFYTKLQHQTHNGMHISEILNAHEGKRSHQYQNIRRELPNCSFDVFSIKNLPK